MNPFASFSGACSRIEGMPPQNHRLVMAQIGALYFGVLGYSIGNTHRSRSYQRCYCEHRFIAKRKPTYTLGQNHPHVRSNLCAAHGLLFWSLDTCEWSRHMMQRISAACLLWAPALAGCGARGTRIRTLSIRIRDLWIPEWHQHPKWRNLSKLRNQPLSVDRSGQSRDLFYRRRYGKLHHHAP